MPRQSSDFLDLSDVIETFDRDEIGRLLDTQLESLHNDSCEHMVDNFQLLYARYKKITEGDQSVEETTLDEIKALYQDICELFIRKIADAYNISLDETYIEDHEGDLHNMALQLYLFFVLDFQSNLFNILLGFISEHIEDIAKQFEGLRARRDSITEVNRTMEDQNIALVCSNIYDVIDWVLEQLEPELFLDYLEDSYLCKRPMVTFLDRGVIDGGFMGTIRDNVKANISLKGKIGFDIIIRLKGVKLDS